MFPTTTLNASHRIDTAGQIATMLKRAFPDVMAVYVYGSTARGDAGANSDVDIAVLLPPGRQLADKLALSARLGEATGRQVDLRQVSNFLRMEVLKDGRQILNTTPGQVLAWKAYAMGEYARHRTAIGDIPEDFSSTGIGYYR